MRKNRVLEQKITEMPQAKFRAQPGVESQDEVGRAAASAQKLLKAGLSSFGKSRTSCALRRL